jgi:methionyl aminopeptidase
MNNKIQRMQEGGIILGGIRDRVILEAKEGVKTIDIDRLAEKLISNAGGKPSFKMVDGYSWTTCICVNECIVHGIPNSYLLKKNDTVTIDLGMFYKGYHTDTASSIIVGNEDDRFLEVGKLSLKKAIEQARFGNRVGNISKVMQKIIEGEGYNVSRTLIGHGIGRKLHDDPQVPCYVDKNHIEQTPLLKKGMTLAIEVIYMEGKHEIKVDQKDGWSIYTKDGSRSAMFEHTIAITNKAPLILTR